MPMITPIKISPLTGRGGINWSSYWTQLISATVENAAPTHVVLTFPTAQTSLVVADFTIAGFTVLSLSWTGAVLTLVLSEAVIVFDEDLTITFVKTGGTATVTNNVVDDGNTVAWYDYADTDTLTDDGGGLISKWEDKLGSGHDLLATTTARPTLGATGIAFNGTANYMKTNAFAYNRPEMLYFVVNIGAGLANRALCDGNASGSALIYQVGYISDVPTPYAGAELKANERIIGSYHILRVLFNGANSTIQHNVLAKKTGNAGNANAGGITIGAWGSNDKFGTFEVKEIIYRNAADNDVVQTAIYNYLKKKCSL
jgi:hypothetical protein